MFYNTHTGNSLVHRYKITLSKICFTYCFLSATFEPLNQTCWSEKLLIKLESCYSDLSGNQFSGPYPLSQISSMNGLQELSLAGNLFEGPVPDDAILNKTQLDKL